MILLIKNLKKYFVSNHYSLKNLLSLLIIDNSFKLLFLIFVIFYIFTIDNVAFAAELDPDEILNKTQKEYKFYKDWKFWGAVASVVTVGVLAIFFFSGSDDDESSSSSASIDIISKLDTATIETAKVVDTTDVITKVVEVVPPDFISAVSSVDAVTAAVVTAAAVTTAAVTTFTHQDAVAILVEFKENIDIDGFNYNYLDRTFNFLIDNIEISRHIFASNYVEYDFLNENNLRFRLSWITDSIVDGLFSTYSEFSKYLSAVPSRLDITIRKSCQNGCVRAITGYLTNILSALKEAIDLDGSFTYLNFFDDYSSVMFKPYHSFCYIFSELLDNKIFWWLRNTVLPTFIIDLRVLCDLAYNMIQALSDESNRQINFNDLVVKTIDNIQKAVKAIPHEVDGDFKEGITLSSIKTFMDYYRTELTEVQGYSRHKINYAVFDSKLRSIINKLIKFFKL